MRRQRHRRDALGAREMTQAAVAQSVERVLGKDEVKGPNPLSSSYCIPLTETLDPTQGE